MGVSTFTGNSAGLLTEAGQTHSGLLYKGISCPPLPRSGSSQGHFLGPDPLAGHPQAHLPCPSLPPPSMEPEQPCPHPVRAPSVPLLTRAAAWCWDWEQTKPQLEGASGPVLL